MVGGRRRRNSSKMTYLATACAHKNAPVVLTSNTRRHSSARMSTACTHPTTPAKQHRISTLPNSAAVSSTARSTCAASVTSTRLTRICAPGKSAARDLTSESAWAKSRSRSARLERPCSRRARALMRARVPAPPVTVLVSHFREFGFSLVEREGGFLKVLHVEGVKYH